MNRCWKLLCLGIVLGACQSGLDTPEATVATTQAVNDCTAGGNFCGTPSPQIPYWQGQQPPLAGPKQSYHIYTDPLNQSEMVVALADVGQGKIVWAVRTGTQQQPALLGKVYPRGPIDIVRPPPPPPPVGDEWLLERALRYQQLHAEATAAQAVCGP